MWLALEFDDGDDGSRANDKVCTNAKEDLMTAHLKIGTSPLPYSNTTRVRNIQISPYHPSQMAFSNGVIPLSSMRSQKVSPGNSDFRLVYERECLLPVLAMRFLSWKDLHKETIDNVKRLRPEYQQFRLRDLVYARVLNKNCTTVWFESVQAARTIPLWLLAWKSA
jgi:hypothetical protein